MFKPFEIKFHDVYPFQHISARPIVEGYSVSHTIKCNKCGHIWRQNTLIVASPYGHFCPNCKFFSMIYYPIEQMNALTHINDIYIAKIYNEENFFDIVVYSCYANINTKEVKSFLKFGYRIDKKTSKFSFFIYEDEKWEEYEPSVIYCPISRLLFSATFSTVKLNVLRRRISKCASFATTYTTPLGLAEYISLVIRKPEVGDWFENYTSLWMAYIKDINRPHRIFSFNEETKNIRDFLFIPKNTPEKLLNSPEESLMAFQYLKKYEPVSSKLIEWFDYVAFAFKNINIFEKNNISPTEIKEHIDKICRVAGVSVFDAIEMWEESLQESVKYGYGLSEEEKFPMFYPPEEGL